MSAKKTIFDLFVRGQELALEDGDNKLKVWVQKLSPVEQDQVLRKANGKKMTVLALRHSDSDERYERHDFEKVVESRDSMITWLASMDAVSKREMIVERTKTEEPWDESTVNGLYEAWFGGLMERYATDDNGEDEEAQAVFAEIKKFEDLVNEKVDEAIEDCKDEYEIQTDAELYEMVVDKLIEHEANQAWLQELRMGYVWLGTRDNKNHSVKLFSSREQVDTLPAETLKAILDTYDAISVGVTEGKS